MLLQVALKVIKKQVEISNFVQNISQPYFLNAINSIHRVLENELKVPPLDVNQCTCMFTKYFLDSIH